MLIDQTAHRAKRVAMQTVKKLAWGFSFSQATTAVLILGQWNLLDLLQQFLLAFRQKQNLALPKVPQLAGRFATTDSALVVAQPAKQSATTQGRNPPTDGAMLRGVQPAPGGA
jgi:hypothetical protein